MKNWYIAHLDNRIYFGRICKSYDKNLLFAIHIQHSFDTIDNTYRVFSTQTQLNSAIAEKYIKLSKKTLIKKLILLGIDKKVLDNTG